MQQSTGINAGTELDVAKLRDMICFFAGKGRDSLGKTKLMKLLYYSDFGFYAKHGKSISGATYTKYPRGPVPEDALRELPKMVADRVLEQKIVNVGGYAQESHLLVDNCGPYNLSRDEVAYLEHIWKKWGQKSVSAIVTASHEDPPWKAVDMYEEIPYSLAYFF
jgi:uncharacterized phage-associated protein